jgi:predicted permease
MRSWLRTFRKPRPTELDQELRFHLEELVQEKIASGLTPDQARREAALEFGGAEQIKEELRDVHRIPFIDAIWTHTRYAFRVLRASRSFSLAVIATLTLGIGANTAVFSAIDAVLLRPLPYPSAERLIVLHEYRAKLKSPVSFVAPARLEDWNRYNNAFQAITGYDTEDTVDTSGPLPVKIKRAVFAPRFLQTLGVSPELGRDFTSEDEHFHGGALGSVMISDRFWRTHFHAQPDAIGKPLFADRASATVIGVMPPSFAFPDDTVDLWYISPPDAPYAQDRHSTWFTAIGRLKPGVTEQQARANLDLVQRQLARQFPATDTDVTVELQPLKDTTVGRARASLWLLFAAVSVLLLMACVNVASLLLARGMERAHEFSLRFALGASRFTIVAQVLTESLLLAIGGGVTGLAVAAAAAKVLASMAKSIPRIDGVGLDWRLFLYTASCAVAVTLLSGLFPALHAGSTAPAGSLTRGGRGQVSRGGSAQSVLVSIQVALAVCLLSGAGLLLRSFQALSEVSPGFDMSKVLVFRVTGTYWETSDIPRLTNSINRGLDALRSVHGVEAAAASAFLPGVPVEYPTEVTSPDSGFDPQRPVAPENRFVSEGYFAAMHIPILLGNACDKRLGVVVNRSFASTYFGDTTPIGHHLAQLAGPWGVPLSPIVGVAADARETGLDREPRPTVYWCVAPIDPGRYYLVRTAGDPASLAGTLRQQLRSIEPTRAVYDMSPLPEHLGEAYAQVRLRTVLLTLFAATALSLACVGLYGSMAYFVTTRRREIGLRLALGARRGQIRLRFVGRGLAVAGIGMTAGLALAAWSARFLSGMLYHVPVNDATALFAAVAAMFVSAALASAIPAVRATRVDPMQILREE